MAHLRGLLPGSLDHSRPFTALRHAFPEGVDRQTVVFVPGVRGEIPRIGTHFFGLTVERHPRAWRVAGVQREWWNHRSGCRAWFIAERDTRTNEVLSVALP